jgi:Protein of unknown function (DUF4233)
MRVLGSAVLTMEFLVMGFALLLAKNSHSSSTLLAGGLIALLLLLNAGLMKRRIGWFIGTLLQVALVWYGVAVTAMYFLGGLFALLWVSAFYIGRRGEAISASRRAASSMDSADGMNDEKKRD